MKCGDNMKKDNLRKTKLWKKVVSVLTAFALLIGSVPIGTYFGIINSRSVMAASSDYKADLQPNDEKFSGNTININAASEFYDFCHWYRLNASGFAQTHQYDRIIFSAISQFSSDFGGLGHETYPFGGVLEFSGGAQASLELPSSLFTYALDTARINQYNSSVPILMHLKRNSSDPSALIADHVTHDARCDEENATVSPATWTIDVVAENENSYGGIIGEMQNDAKLSLTFTNNSSASLTANGDIGLFCGTLANGSILTVDYTENCADTVSITSTGGNAGGIVGKMKSGSKLVLNNVPDGSKSVTSTDGYAGGIVGAMTSEATIDIGSISTSPKFTVEGSAEGKKGAGGLFGHYENYKQTASFDLADYSVSTAVSGDFCGGLFGVLENKYVDENDDSFAELTITDSAYNAAAASGFVSAGGSGVYGGIIGKYSTSKLSDTLTVKNINYSAGATNTLDSFGGVIGVVGSKAYLKVNDLAVSASGTDKGLFGGVLADSSEECGVFLDLGNFKLSADAGGFTGGGIVGRFEQGVLRLSGITDMSGAKAKSGGQLVGENNNALIYALGNGSNYVATPASGWTFKRSSGSTVDDLGTWGEVVRIADIEDSSSGILTFDGSAHTVTLKAAAASMGTAADFAKTALNIQLNQGDDYDCLRFTSGTANTRAALLGSSSALSITNDFSLAGTGITGFMRDGGDADDIGRFTGRLNGKAHSVTLASGETYGTGASGQTEGMGQIYRHPYNGLFSVIGNGTSGTGVVENLKLDGSITVHNYIDGMYIGGIAAKSNGNTTLNSIAVLPSMTINYSEPVSVTGTESAGKNVAGLIGAVTNDTDNGTIEIKGDTSIGTTFNLSGNHSSWDVVGSAVAKVTSPKFAINIGQNSGDSVTDSHKMIINEISSVGTNADGGGLIGYILANGTYTDRKINIKNLSFDGTEVKNLLSTNGGGLLGYAWLSTDTIIDGLTVADSTIINTSAGGTASEVGVMLYGATGKLKVNSLSIDKLSMTDGAGNSLGMLVNKAYHLNSKNELSGGLYLDVLKSGYSLTPKTAETGITLPSTLGIYDEIAAFSAPDVLKGGAGVVSINMNNSRAGTEAKITVTGTYQNQLTNTSSAALSSTKYANCLSRYYYNLDVLNNSDNAHKMLMWSVSKYAAANISSAFSAALPSGTAKNPAAVDLTGLSFYPVYNAADITLSGLDITFDYAGIYNTAETVNNNDSYNRDPALENQHYLMQSGLFISLSEGKTVTVNDLSFRGNFLELTDENGDKFSGVIISDTANGSISINGLALAGITAKTAAAADHNTGYLLVNKVSRADSTRPTISLNLSNISTANGYADNAKAAKSLFGDVYGPAISITLSAIRLDARKTDTLSGNSALDAAYSTKSTIFTDATLFNEIKTTQTAGLIYNYSYDEDWTAPEGGTAPRNVTYGKEVKTSIEWAGKENKYYNNGSQDTHFTDPTTDANTAAEYDDFSSGWLKYVAADYDSTKTGDENGCYSRELKVNVPLSEAAEGCGTYNDPYIITSEAQLVAFAKFLNTGIASDLGKVNLPTTVSDYNSLTKNTSGNRWCTDNHALYTANGTNFASGNTNWTAENVRYYLENAYYKIKNDIELTSAFVGFGGTSAGTDNSGKYAFRGVIVGDKNADDTPRFTITNKSNKPFINISNGCVVKDHNIVQAADVSLTQNVNGSSSAAFSYKTPLGDSGCMYYGGIIGEVMGGDNIIDNCYVTQESANKVTISGTSEMLCPVGSYVGVVVFGAVIFKNMTAATVNDNSEDFKVYFGEDTTTNLTLESSKGAIYVNPLVGRVINGYAVNETEGESARFSVTENSKYHDENSTSRSGNLHSLKNTAKHYTIADINKDEEDMLEVEKVPTSVNDNGTIKIPNSQAFFVLSLITQSLAGTASEGGAAYTSSLSYGTYVSYVYSMSHIADYGDVGCGISANKENTVDFALAVKDTAGNTANTNYTIPYIIYNYTVVDQGKYNARCVTRTDGYYDIYLVNGISYQLPDSFRGLGSLGYYDNYNQGKGKETTGYADRVKNLYSMKVDTFNGAGCSIDEDIYFNKYYDDNYFDVLHQNQDATQIISSKTVSFDNDANNHNGNYHGIGMFDSIVMRSDASVISNFILLGSVNTNVFSNDGTGSTGGIGTQYAGLAVGGVVGWALNGTWCNFESIHLNNLSLRGSSSVGGLLGYSGNKSKNIYKHC